MENKSDNMEIMNHRPEPKHNELVQMLLEYWNIMYFNLRLRRIFGIIFKITGITASVVIFISFFLYAVPGIQEIGSDKVFSHHDSDTLKEDPEYARQIRALKYEVSSLARKYSLYTPGQPYLIINTTDNRFSLYNNKKLIREGFCSSGSYTKLTTAEGNRQWIFKTPKGRFQIEGKMTKPLWIRPDWSFVEEGLAVPPADDPSRYEYGVLGDYALSLGDGYLIHGTLYKRYLGMPVTHGCVRLNDEDLEAIYRTLNIGSKVYIF